LEHGNLLGGCIPTEGLISGFAFRVQRRSCSEKISTRPDWRHAEIPAGKPPFRDARRINSGWKTQSLRFPRPKAQEAVASLWTGDHRRPLVLVRLLSQGRLENPQSGFQPTVEPTGFQPVVAQSGMHSKRHLLQHD
jgi:hypothetical protein